MATLVVGLTVFGPRPVCGLRTSQPWPGGSECTAQTPGGAAALTRDEAQRATTAVALAARNTSAPDTSDIDDAVVRALADGPPEDVGPVLHCRAPRPEISRCKPSRPPG